MMDFPSNEHLPFNEESYKLHLRDLRHDINNQLSNILIALEQLRYEVPYPSQDCLFYMDTIGTAATKITSILKPKE